MTKSLLIDLLGKPSMIKKTYKGIDYWYFYFNIKKMPKNYDGLSMILFLNFNFDQEEEKVLSVSDQYSDFFSIV